MNPILLFVGFCILGAIWTAIWAWVLFSVRRPAPYPPIEGQASTLRRRLFYAASAVVVAMFLVSSYWLPYGFIRSGVLGTPVTRVSVLAEQWAWTFSQDKFRTGVPIEFDVTSTDVNHGFGLYDPQGHLVGQVQAMPGYVNHLIFTFYEPGTYTVRCLELCGTPHFAMESQIAVAPLIAIRVDSNDGKEPQLTRIALVHMITGFVLFLGMGLLGYAMRLDQAGLWTFDPSLFYQILTLHGAGMLNAALIAALGGMIEALNGSTPLDARYLWTGYVIGCLAFPIVIVATIVGGVGAGWTMLYPLPYHSLGEWSLTAALAVYVAYFLTAIAFLIYGVVFLVGTIRAAGGVTRALALDYLFSWGRRGADRLPSPSQLAAIAVSIDGIGTVILGGIWLVPRFFDAGGLIGSTDALFVKNVLMGFGHMITNLAMYTALGSLFAMLPIITGRELKTSIPIVLALDLVILVLIVPFGHHLYQDFAEPKTLLMISEFASFGSTVPVLLVAIMGGLTLIYRSGMRWSVPAILVALGLWGWAFGGIAGLMDAAIPINQVTHNTLWVPGHFHTYYLLGVLAFTFAYMYHLIRERSGGRESVVSRMAAWLYGIGGAGFVLMFMLSGAMSVPRRFAEHIPAWRVPDQISVGFVGLISLALIWLGGELFWRLGRAWRRQ